MTDLELHLLKRNLSDKLQNIYEKTVKEPSLVDDLESEYAWLVFWITEIMELQYWSTAERQNSQINNEGWID
jgi:hypothetical protein